MGQIQIINLSARFHSNYLQAYSTLPYSPVQGFPALSVNHISHVTLSEPLEMLSFQIILCNSDIFHKINPLSL
jgi:hypothetical protein